MCVSGFLSSVDFYVSKRLALEIGGCQDYEPFVVENYVHFSSWSS